MDGSSQNTAHWVGFAGYMILIAGTLECVWVAIPIGGAHLFAAGERYQLNAMGWIILTVGVTQALAAVSIWTDERFGRRIGLTAAMCGAIAALACVAAIPLFSLCLLAIELLVAYALVALVKPTAGTRVNPPERTMRTGSDPCTVHPAPHNNTKGAVRWQIGNSYSPSSRTNSRPTPPQSH